MSPKEKLFSIFLILKLENSSNNGQIKKNHGQYFLISFLFIIM